MNRPARSRTAATIPVAFVLMWASGAIFVELGLRYANPLAFLTLRLVLATAIMWIVTLAMRLPLPKSKREWQDILVTGLFLQVGYQVFFFLALANRLSPGLLAIILGAQPMITAALLRDVPHRHQWVGLALGMAGLTLVVAHTLFTGRLSTLGTVSAVLSLASMTTGTILQKRISLEQPTNMAIQYSGSAAVLFVLTWAFRAGAVRWSPQFAITLAWMVLVISVGATLLLYSMIRRGNLTNVTSLLYLVPPVTALLDYLIFGHTLHLAALAGMALIVAGLLLVNRRSPVGAS